MREWDVETDMVVVGAGGCGLVASLAAADKGINVLLLEKTSKVSGNTSLSHGMVPAAGTRFQKEQGIIDTPEDMAQDILEKNGHESDPDLTLFLCRQSLGLVEWLVDQIGVDLRLVADFKYPGHTQFRMHAPPTRTGLPLVQDLRAAVSERSNIQLAVSSPVRSLVTDNTGAVIGVLSGVTQEEAVKCRKVILACDGFGANRDMLERYCPGISNALYHNHPENTGDGIRWGMELGAAVEHMGAFQGHASLAHPDGILATWAIIMNGGIQVNKEGNRFGDETKDYSAYALEVLRQPDGLAYNIFEGRTYQSVFDGFEEIRQLVELGSVRRSESIEDFADRFGIDPFNLRKTSDAYNQARAAGVDEFGRTEFGNELRPPLYGIQVTAALFHTQGGLKINRRAQVLRPDGSPIANLYAGGGAAVGVSGSGPAGYLSGNGLLTALGWGKVAGEDAADSVLGAKTD